jgi:hypothetical protein
MHAFSPLIFLAMAVPLSILHVIWLASPVLWLPFVLHAV